jgi:hypothetical protein
MPGPLPKRLATATAVVVALLATGCGEETEGPAIGRKGSERAAAKSLGFPAFATKNTTRVGGADETADAAAVALAVYPPAAGRRPAAVALVDRVDWQAGLAASVLMARPIRAPILLGEGGGVPGATRAALESLEPRGEPLAADAQVIGIGDVRAPGGFRRIRVAGRGPAELAAAIDRIQAAAAGGPSSSVVVVSSRAAAYAMPAAGWAAKAGDSVLYVSRTSVPAATRRALGRRRGRARVYVLGPRSVVSARVVRTLRRLATSVKRVGAEGAVANAIAFARYFDGPFGWNVNDPGHGLVLASASRPLDAAAAAPLSASGTYGPLLLTDSANRLPPRLEEFLLDVKPGYRDDPARAVYNHVWLMGDERAIGVAEQARIDELAEVAKVGRR